MQAEPRAAFICTHHVDTKGRIATLDNHVFGTAGYPHPPLKALYEGIETGPRRPDSDRREVSRSGLASLDGPIPDTGGNSLLKHFRLK